jgi:hypothetical protein
MRQLIEFALRSRLLMVVLGVLVLAAGYYSYSRLPVDAFPDVTPTLVQVFAETEGLAPEEVEKYVTYPVEVAMNGLPQLKEVRSVSNFGLTADSAEHSAGAGRRYCWFVAHRAEPVRPGLGGLHRPLRHCPGQRDGPGDLSQPVTARGGTNARNLYPRGLPEATTGADDRIGRWPWAGPHGFVTRYWERGAAPPGNGGHWRSGDLDRPDPPRHPSTLQMVRRRSRTGSAHGGEESSP